MGEITFFESRPELEARQNLTNFISHCRNNLTLYEDQGGFTVNKWHFEKDGRAHAMTFSKYREKQDPYNFDPLDEPFLEFAKANVRYYQTIRQVTSIGTNMVVLRLLHDALIEIHGEADVLKTDGLVLGKVRELADLRHAGSDRIYRIGQQIELLYDLLRDKAIVPKLPEWRNPWPRGKAKATRTDKESRKWQEERCPSLHQMIALAECFARAVTDEDKYWSSVLTLLMFAPSRGGELFFLTIDCLHFADKGGLGVRWYGEKGFGFTIKWVPEILREAVLEAHRRLVEISSPARAAAKFAHDNPGVFLRHKGCIPPPEFPEDRPLSAVQFGYAMNFGERLTKGAEDRAKRCDDEMVWKLFENTKWVKKLRQHGSPTYRDLAQYTLAEYGTTDWPNLRGTDRPIWDALLLIRDREFHDDFEAKAFSWVLPDVNQINAKLAPRSGLKNPSKTLFQRFGILDEDGSDIEITSHQLRVWLSTNAERGGMDSWLLAKWAARARIQDNAHYNIPTVAERDDKARQIMGLTGRPTALEAIKLNLPVSYEDLGLNRIGIADVTEYGMCTHDYAMSPCTKGGECMICKEHACIKGMPKTLSRIKRLEKQVESQFEKAKLDAADGAFGADRWVTHLGWKLAHIRTQRERIESDNTPVGAVLWIAPEHDPSPIKRSLEQRDYKTRPNEDRVVDASAVAALLEVSDA
jgi:hypothetical protein